MNTGEVHKIRIALIENNRFIRSSWEMIFRESEVFELTGVYSNCTEAFRNDGLGNVEVVLLDIKLPGISGIEGLKYLKDQNPNQILIVSTNYDDDEDIFEAIAAGAVGFIPKNLPPQTLCNSIREMTEGRSSMTPYVARNIISMMQRNSEYFGKTVDNFSEREWALLFKISAGKSYSTIAEENSEDVNKILIRIRKIYEKIQFNQFFAYRNLISHKNKTGLKGDPDYHK